MLIIAHRGASTRFPENTMAAFLDAVRMGVPWIELDVRLTADRELLVYHDATIARRALSGMNAREALARGKQHGLDIPRLSQVVRTVRNLALPASGRPDRGEPGRVGLFVECKDRGSEQPLADIIVAEDFCARCVVISFHYSLLKNLKNLLPGVRTGILLSQRCSKPVEILRKTQAELLLPRHPLVNRKMVEEIHSAGRGLVTWTVNREREMRRLIRLGVDGIITDRPDRLRQVRESAGLHG